VEDAGRYWVGFSSSLTFSSAASRPDWSFCICVLLIHLFELMRRPLCMCVKRSRRKTVPPAGQQRQQHASDSSLPSSPGDAELVAEEDELGFLELETVLLFLVDECRFFLFILLCRRGRAGGLGV